MYYGSSEPKPGEEKMIMDEWNNWFVMMGEKLADGGFPTMAMASKRIMPTMKVKLGKSNINGFSVIKADSLENAIEMAKKCPHLKAGGQVEVLEEIPMNV